MSGPYFIRLDRELGIVPRAVSTERDCCITWNGIVYVEWGTSIIRCDTIHGDDLRDSVRKAIDGRKVFVHDRIQATWDFGSAKFIYWQYQVWMVSPVSYIKCVASAAYYIKHWGGEDPVVKVYPSSGLAIASCRNVNSSTVRNIFEMGYHIEAHGSGWLSVIVDSHHHAEYKNLLREGGEDNE